KLDEVMAKVRPALVVISPISEFLEGCILSNSDRSVRRVLSPLARLAEKHRSVIVMVRHLNKRGGSAALYRGGGSIRFIVASRSGWLIAREPGKSGRNILAQVKNNLAPVQPSLAFETVPSEACQPLIVWQGTSAWTADQLLSAAGYGPPAGPRAQA